MAGWLFADLLLGLTIIMLGAQAPPPSPTDPVTDTARFQPDPFQPLPDSTRPPSEEPSTEEPPSEGLPDKEPLAEEPSAEKPPGKKAPEKETSEREHQPEEPQEKKSPVKKEPGEKPGPSPSPCTGLVGGVRAKPVTLSFRVTPGAADGVLAAQVRQELRRHKGNLAGRRVGMVLTFGSDSDGGASGGVQLATRVNTAIRETYPRIFGTAVTRNFHDLSAPSGSISMEIYFVTHGCSATSPGTPGH
jgi:outer membrane biosynthesis protein TonB